MTTLDAYDTWQRFRLLHPLSREPFNDTPANVARWRYHIWHKESQAEAEQGSAEILDCRPVEVIERRAVSSFQEMPMKTRMIYRQIADCFPGAQVYAVGSRVSGEYIDNGDPEAVVKMRQALGREKPVSDYDFFVDRKESPSGALPAESDRLFYVPPGEIKIESPMWDFSRLPENEHQRAIESVQHGRVVYLINLHDTYKLSPYFYCGCSGDEQAVLRHFRQAIADGKIKANNERKPETI